MISQTYTQNPPINIHHSRTLIVSLFIGIIVILGSAAAFAYHIFLPTPAAPLSSTSGSATSYYVSTRGSDSATGTSSRPWKTLKKAADTAPTGSTINISAGTYEPFVITKNDQTFKSNGTGTVNVVGKKGVQDIIRINSTGVTLSDINVTGCVPNPNPGGSFEDYGSSSIRINDGAHNATIKNTKIVGTKATNTYGLPFGCYGILVHDANGSNITGNDISKTGTGVFFQRGGTNAQITNNRIHDNDVIIRNTPGNNDDYGASAIVFSNVQTAPGPVARGNTLKNNFGPSSDYGTDGTGFEIYNSANLTLTANILSDNESILETGAPNGGNCDNNNFTGNTVSGKTNGSSIKLAKGMILRCGKNMAVGNNTFNNIDWWVYVIQGGDVFSASIDGLKITNNTVSDQYQKVYALDVDPKDHGFVIDNNKINFTGPIFSSHPDKSNSASLSEWRAKTSFDTTTTTF